MKMHEIAGWLDGVLEVGKFDDVSNNGIQVAREGDDIASVAFGVDASVDFIKASADAGAQLCVVHHGISWGGGIRRIVGSEYEVVRAAIGCNIALYAVHLPLDASMKCGNNRELARHLKLGDVERAFSYHGNVIGVTGLATRTGTFRIGETDIRLVKGMKVGVCSGGAGEFAVEAKALGCDIYVTGEASWGDVVAARNVGMEMICAGHYETETFGPRALSRLFARRFPSVAVACSL